MGRPPLHRSLERPAQPPRSLPQRGLRDPPHPLDWSNVFLSWVRELARLTQGNRARAVRLLRMAPMDRGGPEGGFISSDDVWRATVLCERENAANGIGGFVSQAAEMCL